MTTLRTADLLAISVPVMDAFARVEPKLWDRRAVLLEIVGELGSLAHHVQLWDGFKAGQVVRSRLADECSDVLFLTLRLARYDAVQLPSEIHVARIQATRATDLVLDMCSLAADLIRSDQTSLPLITQMLTKLVSLSDLVAVNLDESHRLEMQIAASHLRACGDQWPRPQLLRHPWQTLRLWRLLRMR